MKRITAVFLAALMLFSLAQLTAFAESGPSEEKWEDVEYYAYVSLYNYDEEEGVNYGIFKNNEAHNDLIAGAAYDRASNTLTLTDFDHPELYLSTNMMGDDFALCVEGSCALHGIAVYGYGWGGSLRFTGTGTLTVNGGRDLGSALMLYAEDSDARLHFDKDVNVNLYGTEIIGDIFATRCSDKDAVVVLDNGQTMDVTGKRYTYDDEERRDIIMFDESGEHDIGLRLNYPADPDHLYVADKDWGQDSGKYYVRRYDYIERFDSYKCDYSFFSKAMTEQELNDAGYSFVTAPDKVKVDYTDENTYSHRGSKGEKVIRNDDTTGVYVVNTVPGGYSENDVDAYYVRRLVWDEHEDYYVEDTSFSPLELTAEEFNAHFTYDAELTEEQVYFSSWVYNNLPPSEEEGNILQKDQRLSLASDPDTIYIKIGTFGHDDDEGNYVAEGYLICKPYYDEERNAWYRIGGDEDSVHVAYEDFENSGFSFVTETLEEPITLYYLEEGYSEYRHTFRGDKVVKESEPESEFVALRWGNQNDEHLGYALNRIAWNEDKPLFFEDDSRRTVWLTIDEFADSEYSFVMEEQPVKATTHGYFSNYGMAVCVDTNGNRYLQSYDGEVYNYSEDDVLVIGDKTYYVVTPNETLTADDVTVLKTTVVTDDYNYRLNGTEFIYGNGAAPEPTYTLGDVDGDGKVDINDATLVQKIAAEMIVPTEIQKKAADVNRDGSVDINDATLIQKFAAEIINRF